MTEIHQQFSFTHAASTGLRCGDNPSPATNPSSQAPFHFADADANNRSFFQREVEK